MGTLKSSEVHWVVHQYIGVAEGYLGDFTYRSHREFYPAYCDVEIDTEHLEGSTRERFIYILSTCDSRTQGAILRGVAKRFPPGSEYCRSSAAFNQLQGLIKRCMDSAAVDTTDPRISSDLVHHALTDAAILLDQSGPTSAVDRVHTALHAYMKAACLNTGIELTPDLTITALFKLLKQQHPQFCKATHHEDTMARILQSLTNIIDSLNPARNRGSLAHANEHLLNKDDAILVINSSRTVLQYLDAKL